MVRRLAALALAVTILATACAAPSLKRQANKSPSPSPQATPSAIAKASPGAFSWSDCGNGFQCGTVQVPLDYANPQNGTIGIAITRKPATNPKLRIGSLLTNPGGPGASGVDFVQKQFSTGLNDRFDLVGFDPRGIGRSAPIQCLDGPHMDAFQALDPVLDDPEEKQAAIDADKAYAQACQQNSARVLPFVDTVSAARDIDLIRAAVGDEKLTYLGFSYGTFLGEEYAHLFPNHIRALALDGVLDPALNANDLLLAQITSFEQNLQAFFADCKARSTCQWGKSGDPGAKLDALMNKLDATPLQVGNRQLTRALAIIGVIVTLYSQSSWPALDAGLVSAEQGNGSMLLRYSDIYLGRNSDGTYSNEVDANSAVNCLDRPVATDIATYDALGPTYAKASPHFGPATQYSNLGCAYWPVSATGQAGPLTADGAPPILLVGGTGDPATPYVWAQNVHKQLTSSVLLTRNGQGHISYDASACIQKIVDAYITTLTVPKDGTTCTS